MFLYFPFAIMIPTFPRRGHYAVFCFKRCHSIPAGDPAGGYGHQVQVFFGVFLGVTFFVFSGSWQEVRDQPANMRFWNSVAYGITMDVIVSSWLPAPLC